MSSRITLLIGLLLLNLPVFGKDLTGELLEEAIRETAAALGESPAENLEGKNEEVQAPLSEKGKTNTATAAAPQKLNMGDVAVTISERNEERAPEVYTKVVETGDHPQMTLTSSPPQPSAENEAEGETASPPPATKKSTD